MLPSIYNLQHSNTLRLPKKEFSAPEYQFEIEKHVGRVANDWVPAIGANFVDENYHRFSIKRAQAIDCKFIRCNFSKVAGIGSNWSKSKFFGCDFSESNYQYADFQGSEFIVDQMTSSATTIKGACFAGADFANATMDHATIVGTSLTQANFFGATLTNCQITSSTLEGAIFYGAKISNIDLSNTNIEYCDFTGINASEILISLVQFPYVFGLTPEMIKQDRVRVSTRRIESYPNKYFSWEGLQSTIGYLVSYYLDKQNYFPVSNMYLLSGREEDFAGSIESGIRWAIAGRKYRDLKFLAKLAATSNLFSSRELTLLYDLIAELSGNDREPDRKHQFRLHEGEIRSYLLAGVDDASLVLELMLTPKNQPLSYMKMAQLSLDNLESISKKAGLEIEYGSVLVTKNSPAWISAKIKRLKAESDKNPIGAASLFVSICSMLFSGGSFVSNISHPHYEGDVAAYKKKMDGLIVCERVYIRQGDTPLLIYEADKHNPGAGMGGVINRQ